MSNEGGGGGCSAYEDCKKSLWEISTTVSSANHFIVGKNEMP